MNLQCLVRFSLGLAVGFAWLTPCARAGDAEVAPVVAYKNCRILTAAGGAIERGVLVVAGGKIEAVGPVDTTPVPARATVRDLAGKTLIPGMVDTHSHI